MKSANLQLILFYLFICLLVSGVMVRELSLLERIGDNLCQTSDPYSEANTIRGAEYLMEKGFFYSYGLADIAFGNKFLGYGVVKKPDKPSIYTHYPPGPEWLGYLNLKIIGPGNVKKLRYTPMLLSLVSLLLFGYLIFRVEGLVVSVIMTTFVCLTPTYWKMVLALHYHSIALSIFLIMFALTAYVLKASKCGWRAGVSFFTFGFIQGWLSFDFFFLVALLPIPFLLIYSNESASEFLRKKSVIGTLLAPGVGFMSAHGLHFLQNVFYFGTIGDAVIDLVSSAQKRSVSTLYDTGLPLSRIDVVREYLFELPYNNENFGLYLVGTLILFLLICFSAAYMSKVLYLQKQIILKKEIIAVVSSLFITIAWVTTMIQHAGVHKIFIVRHYYLFYLIIILVTCICVRRFVSSRFNVEIW